MDLSYFNPFRKTKTLYNWDNNWRPLFLKTAGPDGALIDMSIIIPDTFYCSIIWMHVQQTCDIGLGSSIVTPQIFHGSDRILLIRFNYASQGGTIMDWFFYHSATQTDDSLGRGMPKMPIPPDFPLVPGDRVTVNLNSTELNPRNPLLELYVKAYYF